MAEYICIEHTADQCPASRERIVRCKDCKHSTEEGIYTECYFCHLDRWNTNPVEASPVEPDGFCAWGEQGQDG